MAYVALYRRWRPQDFETLVGQPAVKTALCNALSSGRLAHAYLFAGPRGTGKTSTARILARALNCEQGPAAKPCGHCVNCERIAAGTSMDVLEIDAASNRGIDEIKALREQLAFTPVSGRYKIYIIDEVHMLTTEAFNALLKTLEEPPAHVIFILATTDPQKIPATIHSRCQRFDFRRVTVDEIAAHLGMVAAQSGIEASAEALRLIAIQADGGLRDALSLLDQCSVMGRQVTADTVREVLGFVGREAVRALVRHIGRQDLPAALDALRTLLEQGRDASRILAELAEYLRAVLLYREAPAYEEIYLTDTAEELAQTAPLFNRDRLMAAAERLHAAVGELRRSARPRITAELCLFDLCRAEGSTLAALAARVEQLEKMLGGRAEAVAAEHAATSAPAASAPQEKPPAPATGMAAKTTRPRPAAAGVPTEPASPPERAAGAASAAPLRPQAVNSQAEPATQGGTLADAARYWQQALEILNGEKKIAMVSCAKNGKVVSFANGLLKVAFSAKFQCDRMNKPDYGKVFEEALLRAARQPIWLECVVAAKEAGQAPPLSAAPSAQDAAAPEDLAPGLQKALQVLGGTLEEMHD